MCPAQVIFILFKKLKHIVKVCFLWLHPAIIVVSYSYYSVSTINICKSYLPQVGNNLCLRTALQATNSHWKKFN